MPPGHIPAHTTFDHLNLVAGVSLEVFVAWGLSEDDKRRGSRGLNRDSPGQLNLGVTTLMSWDHLMNVSFYNSRSGALPRALTPPSLSKSQSLCKIQNEEKTRESSRMSSPDSSPNLSPEQNHTQTKVQYVMDGLGNEFDKTHLSIISHMSEWYTPNLSKTHGRLCCAARLHQYIQLKPHSAG